ncbi:hypothetical protein BOX15_Mlig009786g1 [Macrostomum lignano]|uniref:DH domain-containing protein n=1 Tax=Macrostomum lignano TaxID=282301 RepID=A0A267FY86_9PLAT|nr:hypothetical protein BOX15_Mlig009786g1 [Macrostomum lignano]
MFPPNSDSWRRLHHRADRFVRPSRVSVPVRSLDPDWCEAAAGTASQRFSSVLAADSGWQQQGRSSSLENLAFGRDSRGSKEDKADAFLRNLRAAHLFQSSQAATSQDNRDKLHDYLSQCDECGLPRHNNELLSEISADLAPGAWAQPSDRTLTAGKAVRQQAAIWELCQTELNILRHLKTIIEIYIAVIHYLQSSASLLLDVDTDRLFPDVAAVFSSHCVLWTRHLRPALELAATSEGPVRPRDFAEGFIRFGEIFEPALAFCLRITESKDYLRQLEKNEAFNDFVKWAQKSSAKNYNSNDCSMDLQLKSLLTMPFQRLTKYGLLLQEIQRHTEDGEDREALELMIGSVSKFCNKMNSLYQDKADEEELRGIADRLEDAKTNEQLDALGEECSSQLSKFRLNLRSAMPHNGQPRRKLMEADVRLKDERGKWTDARLLLFTDLMLVTKVYGKRQLLRLLRTPVRLDKLEVCRLDCTSLVLAALTDFKSLDGLHCVTLPEQRLCDDWLERIRQAQAALQSQLSLEAYSVASHPKPVRWLSESQSPPPQPRHSQQLQQRPQQHHPIATSSSGGSGRVRATTLLEVATAASAGKIHAAHSSSELDAIEREPLPQPPSPGREQQQLSGKSQQFRMSEHRHTVLQQWYLSQHHREHSAPSSVLSRSPLRQKKQQQKQQKQPREQQQQRSNSAEEAGTSSATSAAAAAALIPARELTPERRRLMSYISSSGQAPEV